MDDVYFADLARKIQKEHLAASDAADRAVKHARNAGQLLKAAKHQMLHGEWLPWLRDHCDISERTAQNYMRLASLTEPEAQRVADLSLREAVRTIATPKEAAPTLAISEATPKAVLLKETYQVLVTCQGEPDQAALLERLTQEGYTCRALIS